MSEAWSETIVFGRKPEINEADLCSKLQFSQMSEAHRLGRAMDNHDCLRHTDAMYNTVCSADEGCQPVCHKIKKFVIRCENVGAVLPENDPDVYAWLDAHANLTDAERNFILVRKNDPNRKLTASWIKNHTRTNARACARRSNTRA